MQGCSLFRMMQEDQMRKGVLVRFLVPEQTVDGTVSYRMAAQWIRLPLKRDDRAALMVRLEEEPHR